MKIEPFRFNLRYPALTPASTPDGKSYSVLQYQDTHLNAEVLTPLGTPTLIGTFGPNTSDDTYVLILLVKETPQR